jgi:hypothetical protein
MKKVLLLALVLTGLVSCTKSPDGDWVHFSSYTQYVILNNGDTVKYEGGWNMVGLTTGATRRQLTAEEQTRLLNYLDSTCRTGNEFGPFEDLADKWKREFPGQTLGYMMKFQNNQVLPQYQSLSVQDVKTIVCDYDSTYQKYIVDDERRLFYEEFQ